MMLKNRQHNFGQTEAHTLVRGQVDGPFEYLHFNGNKLVKIDVIKNVFR